MIVRVAEAPLESGLAEIERPARYGRTIKLAIRDVGPIVPVTAAICVVETSEVVMPNFAETDPAGTDTEAGTFAAWLLEERETVIPPAGAKPVKLTVPEEPAAPPTTELGLIVIFERIGGRTYSFAYLVTPFELALRVRPVKTVTGWVVIFTVDEAV